MKLILLLVVLFVLTRQACPPNCDQCSSSSYCTRCTDGYMLNGGRCLKCFDANCAQCPNQQNSCAQCFAGYMVTGGKCAKCLDVNCAQCPNNTNSCTECFSGYKVSGGKCIRMLNVQVEWLVCDDFDILSWLASNFF